MGNPYSISAGTLDLTPRLRPMPSFVESGGPGHPLPPPPGGSRPVPYSGAGEGDDESGSGRTPPAKRRDQLSSADQDDRARVFAERLGARLRAARRRRRLSLLDVEKTSGREFRASVLGAYERGERTISVVRLQRLARFYNVPVGRLLVSDDEDWAGEPDLGATPDPAPTEKLTIDLAQLARVDLPDKPLLATYLHGVLAQRQHFDSPVITLRTDDTHVIAGLLGLTVDQLFQRLQERGITPPRS